MRKHNFSAGPAILPQEVIQGAAKAVLELDNIGLSLIEISHRSNEFKAIMEEACSLSLQLLGLEGKGYRAMFLQGGASLQFLMSAYNLLEKKQQAISIREHGPPKLLKKLNYWEKSSRLHLPRMVTSITYPRDLKFPMTWIISTLLPTIPFLEPNTNHFLIPKSLW